MAQGYGGGYPPKPVSQNSDNGMKTCLIIGGVVGGLGFVSLLMCGGVAFYLGNQANQ